MEITYTGSICCGVCGAPIDNFDEAVDNVVSCRFCGRKTILPKTNQTNEVISLLNQARNELSLCKFDDAYELYRLAAEKDKTEPEAYFGMAISDFNIQYLRDYKNDRPLPICHAIAKEEICKDKNFLKALELSSGEQKKEYEERGKDIDAVMECFREYEKQGLNYDVFICSKVSMDDAPSMKTRDCYIAHEVYDILRKDGYKPFFSERDINNLVGVQYEALILYALYKSKCMLVVCTDRKYLRTPYVQNEYTRYINMIRNVKKRKGSISIVFDNETIQNLPGLWGNLQSIKFGAIDTGIHILNFAKNYCREEKPTVNETKPAPAQTTPEPKKTEERPVQKTTEITSQNTSEDNLNALAEKIVGIEMSALEKELSDFYRQQEEEERQAQEATMAKKARKLARELLEKKKKELEEAKKRAAKPKVNIEEKTLTFGSYPQSQVEDEELIAALTKIAGTLPTEENAQKWTSYKYYIEKEVKDFMWYIDVEHDGKKYRGVYFTTYKPDYTEYDDSSWDVDSQVFSNGYNTGKIYWFKYEPINWNILKAESGEALILADMILDSQHYYHDDEEERTIDGKTIYANNYAHSDIRAWLNDNFYNTAFNSYQKEYIKKTTVDNSASTTANNNNSYACENTEDNVFLLSYKDMLKTCYGYNSSNDNDTTRRKETTAYAQCQGANTATDDEYKGNGHWLLRSPDSNECRYALDVLFRGLIFVNIVDDASLGVCPALKIALD